MAQVVTVNSTPAPQPVAPDVVSKKKMAVPKPTPVKPDTPAKPVKIEIKDLEPSVKQNLAQYLSSEDEENGEEANGEEENGEEQTVEEKVEQKPELKQKQSRKENKPRASAIETSIQASLASISRLTEELSRTQSTISGIEEKHHVNMQPQILSLQMILDRIDNDLQSIDRTASKMRDTLKTQPSLQKENSVLKDNNLLNQLKQDDTVPPS